MTLRTIVKFVAYCFHLKIKKKKIKSFNIIETGFNKKKYLIFFHHFFKLNVTL